MALDVISEIKAAEDKALEIRRSAAAAAKEAVKLAAEENAATRENELKSLRQASAASIEAAGEAAKCELEALRGQWDKECEELKSKAQANLSRAADACLGRILK
jgi:vacuolar-type H+-ATPase subunit H